MPSIPLPGQLELHSSCSAPPSSADSVPRASKSACTFSCASARPPGLNVAGHVGADVAFSAMKPGQSCSVSESCAHPKRKCASRMSVEMSTDVVSPV